MKREFKSNEFTNVSYCNTKRKYASIDVSTEKNRSYDTALIGNEIIAGFFKGEFQISEFPELISEGYEEQDSEEQGRLQAEKMAKLLTIYCSSETRKPYLFPKRETVKVYNSEGDEYLISVNPYIFAYNENGVSTLEFVLYKMGKPTLTMNGRKKTTAATSSIELRAILEYGIQMAHTLYPKDTAVSVKAGYYFMRRTDDRTNMLNPDFFDDAGGNIVYLQEFIKTGEKKESENAKALKGLLDEFEKGRECSEEDCKFCDMKVMCHYQKLPQLQETKTLNSKNGKITPSDSQQAIIDFRQGYCRVNATAGSGKTECMTERGARLIAEGTKPEEILFITFTDAGALEMKERITKKCSERYLNIAPDQIKAMTFNSFAYEIVKENYAECGFTKIPTVIDDTNNRIIISKMISNNIIGGLDYLNFDSNLKDCKGALICTETVFGIMKDMQLNAQDIDTVSIVCKALTEKGMSRFYNGNAVTELVSLYDEYQKQLIEDNLITFADQEPMMNHILSLYPDYLDRYGYRHIIVDEFQDSNDVQLDTIKKLTLTPSFTSLMVVGDDSQSIYGFRRTSPENIIYFFDKLGVTGIDLYLTENRRSTPEITELSNQIIDLNTEKVNKIADSVREHGKAPEVHGFCSKEDEYDFITEKIKEKLQQGYLPEDIAFIAAKKTELMKMASKLSKAGIPFVMKNPMTLMENSRVLAAISLAEAFYQPEATANYLNYLIAKYDGELFNVLTEDQIKTIINDMKTRFTYISNSSLNYQRLLFHKMLNDIKGNDEVYAYFLDLLYANQDLPTELEYIQYFKRFGQSVAKKMEQSYQGVVLTTAHSSKGLEWKVVFNSLSEYDSPYLHTNPKKKIKEIEEKRRLLFVSMTRARDELYVTGQYVAFGNKLDRTYNTFLREVMIANGDHYDPVQAEYQYELKKQEEKAKEKNKDRAKKQKVS